MVPQARLVFVPIPPGLRRVFGMRFHQYNFVKGYLSKAPRTTLDHARRMGLPHLTSARGIPRGYGA